MEKVTAPSIRITPVQHYANCIKRRIMQALQWSELEYHTAQFEGGLAYLDCYLKNECWGKDQLKQNKTFWAWWRNQWVKRDEQFMRDIKGGDFTAMRAFYETYHDAAILAEEIYPA